MNSRKEITDLAFYLHTLHVELNMVCNCIWQISTDLARISHQVADMKAASKEDKPQDPVSKKFPAAWHQSDN